MGPKLKARLATIASMSKSDLAQLRLDLRAAFDLIDDNGGSVDEMTEIADAVDEVKAEETKRDEADALRDRVHDDGDAGEQDDSETTPDYGAPEEEQAPVDAPANPDTVPTYGEPNTGDDDGDTEHSDQPEGIAASTRPPLADVKRAQSTSRKAVQPTTLRVKSRMVAAGDVAGFSAGQEITTTRDLALAIQRKLESIGRNGPSGDVVVASIHKEYPAERTLGDDAMLNDEMIEKVVGAEALVASGGLCQPVAVDYAINTIGSTARPLQSSLPSFAATRGGLRFTPQPLLGTVTPPTPYTIAMDVAATPKTCFTIVCGTPVEADVYGIPVCIKVGNFQGRFAPETVAAQASLLDVATARVAEATLLNAIDAGSTAVTSTGVLGEIRTILPTLDLLNAGYRYRNRLDNTSQVRLVLPAWVRDAVRADSFGGAQGAGALNAWPNTFVAYYYAEGTWQFLDGGRIDLGVTRDSTLNATNDYEIWREDFEGIAKRGAESLKCTVTTHPTGMSAGTLQVA
jgi:hypothetical protein